jgi:hypothetical protein
MKSNLCIFLIAALCLAISMRAQDAPTRPIKDPTAGSNIEPTPLPRSSATPVPEASNAKPEQSQVPKPSPAPTAETAQLTPSATPTPEPEKSPAKAEKIPIAKTPRASRKPPAKTEEIRSAKTERQHNVETGPRTWGDTRAVVAKLKAMEKEWEASFNDPAVIEKTLADDFVGTSPGGKTVTKKSLLVDAKENKSPPPTTTAHHLDVRFYGSDIAVVTGAAKQIDKNRAGQKVERNFRFTDTWVERDGKWQCVASQAMLLPRQ